MKATKIGILAALVLGCFSGAASAEETKAPNASSDAKSDAKAEAKVELKGTTTLPIIKVVGRRQRPMNIADIAKLTPSVQLSPLRQPFLDRIGQAVDKGPF